MSPNAELSRRALMQSAVLLPFRPDASLAILVPRAQENTADIEAQRKQRIDDYIRKQECLDDGSQIIGGEWVSPEKGNTQLTTDELTIAVSAYPATHKDRELAFVVFTGHWDKAPSPDPKNPGAWYIFDIVDSPDKDGFYRARANFKTLGIAPDSKVSISFDVVNKGYYRHEAPNGIHQFTYKPQP